MKLLDRLLWWWGYWRARPHVYAHNAELKVANEYTRRLHRTLAYIVRNRPGPREHHRDLFQGLAIALRTGLVMSRGDRRPGPHLRKRPTVYGPGKRVGKPIVFKGKQTSYSETEWL